MTIKVTVTHEEPEEPEIDKNIYVTITDSNHTVTIAPGKSDVFYVHKHNSLIIKENK